MNLIPYSSLSHYFPYIKHLIVIILSEQCPSKISAPAQKLAESLLTIMCRLG
ncbi:hypothetical protein SAB1383 [Staphylococcus aureus RF122]|nr:hypothetical protein SAB1383 [Staphylococcus aureus RF122]